MSQWPDVSQLSQAQREELDAICRRWEEVYPRLLAAEQARDWLERRTHFWRWTPVVYTLLLCLGAGFFLFLRFPGWGRYVFLGCTCLCAAATLAGFLLTKRWKRLCGRYWSAYRTCVQLSDRLYQICPLPDGKSPLQPLPGEENL
ncbi:hypothetical protein H7271_07705 [Bittarella massiliensis]|uniref:hypothetical protein n=1 Tax=Bittarella massiliensis (ex Durand et al. 2017) TaxID=1720313 RepID=UPI00163C45B3|nr:hypothetical protein [Bittarella massiliensis (ex Durand et al. 2017)]MBC2871487.1 hypothetical protein [Bittarella massiliensis (ex Durand et al. 2017)]